MQIIHCWKERANPLWFETLQNTTVLWQAVGFQQHEML